MKNLCLLGVLTVAMAAPAYANLATDNSVIRVAKRSADVDIRDIDHTNERSAAELRARVEVAATLVCNPAQSSDTLSIYRKRHCTGSIVEDFDKQWRAVSARRGSSVVQTISVNDPAR